MTCLNCGEPTTAPGLCRSCKSELDDLPAEFKDYILECEKLVVGGPGLPGLVEFIDQFTLKVRKGRR